jgi:glycosyltransferase involved in cell wall biosynthesis
MGISVVLCTYNNDDRLQVTLESLCQLNRPEGVEWELIAVDNNSTDRTEEVIRAFEGRLPIDYVYESEQGKSRALNTGVGVAQGELIVFTDDDVEPTPGWLGAYWEAYQKRPEGYYFGGPIDCEYEGDSPDDDLLQAAPPSVSGMDYGSEPHEEDLFIGPNWACPAKHLRRAGPFDVELGPNPNTEGDTAAEETDMMVRLREQGVKGWYEPGAKISLFVPASKCTLEHVVSRNIANVDAVYPLEEVYEIFGVPVGMYRQALLRGAMWIVKKGLGRKWKTDYGSWRVWCECIRVYHRKYSGRHS